jgi:hypothetical protein
MAILGAAHSEARLIAVGNAVEIALGGPFSQRHRPTWRLPVRG